jgi:hypothetical protein
MAQGYINTADPSNKIRAANYPGSHLTVVTTYCQYKIIKWCSTCCPKEEEFTDHCTYMVLTQKAEIFTQPLFNAKTYMVYSDE